MLNSLGVELIYFGYLGRAISSAYLKLWHRRLQRVARVKTTKLRQQRREALALQRQLGEVLPSINGELHRRLGGPNTDQLIQAHDLNHSEIRAEFDLAHLNINVKRVEKIWLDLVFETPNFNRISLVDLAFSKRPRVEI